LRERNVNPDEEEFDEQFLPPEIWHRLLDIAARQNGLTLTFEAGSNPHLHVHVHTRSGQSMSKSSEYIDASSGATGAKSFGEKSQAINTGRVAEQSGANFAELTHLLEELIPLLTKVEVPDRQPINNVAADLNGITAEAKTLTPVSQKSRDGWQRTKKWIDGALAVGLFGASAAERVKEIVQKVAGVLKQ
jgi:hypothetical protein